MSLNKERREALETGRSPNPEVAIHRLRVQLKDARRGRKRAVLEVAQLHDRLDLALGIQAPTTYEPIKTPKKKKGKRTAAAVICCSDWHIEETVTPEQIGGFDNTYNPDVSAERAERLFVGAVDLIKHHTAGMFQIPDVVLWFGGDMISGYLREEDLESNAMSPTEAILLWQKYAIRGIHHLLKKLPKVRKIHVVCSYGNHGRTTLKSRHATGAENSYEWMAYHTLDQVFEDNPRVKFTIPKGAQCYTDVYGTVVRWHHGDHISYRQGILGLGVPASKKIAGWDQSRRADVTVIGHFHQLGFYPSLVTNGSLIGPNAYSMSLGCKPEKPQQAFFLIDSKMGVCQQTAIWVGK
jgi:hypothetical protein